MKPYKLLSISFCLLCLCSCKDHYAPRILTVVDSLTYVNPDSAIILLNSIKESMKDEPESTQMYYQLLRVKADDKAYVTHTSDSLILPVVLYYEGKKDKMHLMEAYYYAGRVCSDLGDSPQALSYFQKAVDASKDNTDYRAISRIYSQIGELYLYQDIYADALKAYREAYYYNSMAKDSAGLVFNLRDIGRNYTGLNKADSTLYYYKAAYILAKKLNNHRLMNIVQGELASLYIQLKKYDDAKEALQSPLNNVERSNQSAIYFISAKLHYQTGDMDSASYYSHLVLKDGTIYAKQSAHWILTQIAEKQGDCQTAMAQVKQYMACTDSIQKMTNTEAVRKIQSLYNYQLREKENNRLRVENAGQKLWISYTLLSVIVVIAFVIVYMQYNKRRRDRLKEQLRKLKLFEQEQYQKSTQFIEENNKRIKELEEQLHIAQKEDSPRLALLQVQQEQYLQISSKAEIDKREQELAETAFFQSSVYELVHQLVNGNGEMTDNDWEELSNAIDATYKGFTSRLYALYPFSHIEIQICLLLKAKISVTGIAFFTGRSKSAITSARKKMYEKVYGEVGKPEQWDALIYSF